MAKFSDYPAAVAADYANASTFLMQNEDGDTVLGDLENLKSTFFCSTLCTSVSISSAEVLALFTTPKEIIAAQGSGTIIQPVAAMGKMVNNTLPYATNVTFNLYFSGSSSSVFSSSVFINSTLASPLYHQFQPIQPTIVSNSNLVENAAMYATVAVGNPTGGDGDLEIFVLYRVINV